MTSTVSRGSVHAADTLAKACVEERVDRPADGPVDGPVDGGPVDTATTASLDSRLWGRMTPMVLALVALQSTATVWQQLRQHANFGTYGYDAGLYDQALWLLARHPFSSPFLTSRGLPVWGHHVNPILLPLAQLTRLGAGVMCFAVMQTVAVLMGALPVSWLTRAKTGSAAAGVGMAAIYLVYPANLFTAWSFFHPELLAVLPMLLMAWFAHQRRFVPMWVTAVVAMSCREEVAVAVAGFAVVELVGAMRRQDRARCLHLLGLMVVAGAWFVIASKLIIPAALGGEPFYLGTFYGKYGESYGAIASNLLHDPSLAKGLLTEGNRTTFLLDLFGPLALVPLFGAPILGVAAPLSGLLMSSNDMAHEIQSHYPAVLIAGIFLAAVEVLRATWSRRVGQYVLVLMLTCSAAASTVRSPAIWSLRTGVWKTSEPKRASLERAVSLIPDDAAVTALGSIVPRLSHRQVVYQFPNPLERWFYGEFAIDDPSGAAAPTAQYPYDVDWLVVDRSGLGSYRTVLDRVIADGTFQIVFDEQDVVVARRVAGGNP